MRLPIIKHLVQFIENDSDYIEETISVLENLTENPTIKDEEIDVIGELIQFICALEVSQSIEDEPIKKMHLIILKRVQGSIN